MNRILFEGTELSGKSTIIQSVYRALNEKGYEVVVNSGPLQKNSKKVSLPLNFANRTKSQTLRELGYSASMIFDRVSNEIGSDYFLQERGFPSVVAFSRVFNHLGVNRYFGRIIIPFYPHFDYNFLISASQEDRIKRLSERKNNTWLDELVESDPEKILTIEDEIRKVMSNEKNYAEINTSKQSLEEATEEIIGRIK